MCLQYGESVGVADWFQSFCAVFHTHAGTGEPEEATPSSQGSRRRGKMQQHTSSQVLTNLFLHSHDTLTPNTLAGYQPCLMTSKAWHSLHCTSPWCYHLLVKIDYWAMGQSINRTSLAGAYHQVHAREEARAAGPVPHPRECSR